MIKMVEMFETIEIIRKSSGIRTSEIRISSNQMAQEKFGTEESWHEGYGVLQCARGICQQKVSAEHASRRYQLNMPTE